MRIAVIGAGGAGGLIGAMLIRAGHAVEFLTKGRQWEALRTIGLKVESTSGNYWLPAPVPAFYNPEDIVNPQVVLLAVKAGEVKAVLPSLSSMLGPGTIVVTIQNGIRTVDEVEEIVGANVTYGGAAYFVSYLVAPGHIKHLGVEPRIDIGNIDGRIRLDGTAIEFIDALQGSCIHAKQVANIREELWSKIVLASALGAVGSLTRVSIGEFRRVTETRSVLLGIMREVVTIAASQRIPLQPDCAEKMLEFVDMMPADGSSSLQRDIMAGKPSELEYVIGDLVRRASSMRIDAPLLMWSYSCLSAAESTSRSVSKKVANLRF